MDARVLSVPYVVGREGTGMGAGPLALAAEVAATLGGAEIRRLALSAPATNEVGACFDLNRQLGAEIGDAVADGAMPVVLTGNCHSQQAVVAGLGDGVRLVWLDCHGDFSTPESTTTGFFDGCALAMVAGHCWTALCASVAGFRPLPEERILLIGARDLEPAEQVRLDASPIVRLGPGETGRIADGLRRIAPGADGVSLHVDLDVLDPSAGRANAWAVGPGLGREKLLGVVRAVAREHRVAALTLSAYDPAFDTDGRVAEAALAVVAEVGSAAGSRPATPRTAPARRGSGR